MVRELELLPLIDIQHVTYAYPDLVQEKGAQVSPALHDVSLHIGQGEFVALLGHNGSGKSTLARHCNALLLPASGSVRIAGMDTAVVEKQRAIRDCVGMVFQNPDSQIIATIVEDDVSWALAVRGIPREEIRERVEQAMSAVGIAHLRQMPPYKLSGGQRQRLALAGVLVLRPQCIITDEATSMLDPLSRREITALLHQLHENYGLTIIQVTHLLEEAAQAQRIVVMGQGRVLLDGPPATIFTNLSLLRSLKLHIPEPVELADRLRRSGLPISSSAVTLETIVRELAL